MRTAPKTRVAHNLRSLAQVYLQRFGGRPRPQLVDDTLQEAWKLASMRGVRLVNSEGGLAPKAVPLVMHAAGTVIRGGHRLAAPRLGIPAGEVPDPATAVAQSEISEILARELRAMDPADRALLIDHHMTDVGIDEIANSFGLPPGTMKTRLFRARNRLRCRLEAAGVTADILDGD